MHGAVLLPAREVHRNRGPVQINYLSRGDPLVRARPKNDLQDFVVKISVRDVHPQPQGGLDNFKIPA